MPRRHFSQGRGLRESQKVDLQRLIRCQVVKAKARQLTEPLPLSQDCSKGFSCSPRSVRHSKASSVLYAVRSQKNAAMACFTFGSMRASLPRVHARAQTTGQSPCSFASFQGLHSAQRLPGCAISGPILSQKVEKSSLHRNCIALQMGRIEDRCILGLRSVCLLEE